MRRHRRSGTSSRRSTSSSRASGRDPREGDYADLVSAIVRNVVRIFVAWGPKNLVSRVRATLGRLSDERAAGGGEAEAYGAGVCWVRTSLQQGALLQCADDFRGHHPIRTGLFGDRLLGGRTGHVLQPARRGEQHELGRREAERAQSGVQCGSPGQRRVMQPKPRRQHRPGVAVGHQVRALSRAVFSRAANVLSMSVRMRLPK